MNRQASVHRAGTLILALTFIIAGFVGISSAYETGSTAAREGGHDPLTEWAIKLLGDCKASGTRIRLVPCAFRHLKY